MALVNWRGEKIEAQGDYLVEQKLIIIDLISHCFCKCRLHDRIYFLFFYNLK